MITRAFVMTWSTHTGAGAGQEPDATETACWRVRLNHLLQGATDGLSAGLESSHSRRISLHHSANCVGPHPHTRTASRPADLEDIGLHRLHSRTLDTEAAWSRVACKRRPRALHQTTNHLHTLNLACTRSDNQPPACPRSGPEGVAWLKAEASILWGTRLWAWTAFRGRTWLKDTIMPGSWCAGMWSWSLRAPPAGALRPLRRGGLFCTPALMVDV